MSQHALHVEKEEIKIEFLKKHSKLISNIFVVLLVIGAIIVKVEDRGWDAVFHIGDAYMLAGALLAFIVLRMFVKRHQEREERK